MLLFGCRMRGSYDAPLHSRLICLVFGRCASLFGAYVFGFNMRATHALHIAQIHGAA
jgi:hypothetical protein